MASERTLRVAAKRRPVYTASESPGIGAQGHQVSWSITQTWRNLIIQRLQSGDCITDRRAAARPRADRFQSQDDGRHIKVSRRRQVKPRVDFCSQAYATREDFAQQRTMLASIDSRMGGVLSQMPGINSLITMIRTRRRRDTFIIGGVAAICMLLLLGYLFGF